MVQKYFVSIGVNMPCTQQDFGESKLYKVDNGEITFFAMDYGATLTKLIFNGRNVVLGYNTFNEYKTGGGSLGGIVGRVANRIKDAKFTLYNKTYTLDSNELGNCLHGGYTRYNKIMWECSDCTLDNCVEFHRVSKALEQGFPGNLDITIRYYIKNNTFTMEYFATTDITTIVSLTNHSYYNLFGNVDIKNDTSLKNTNQHNLLLDCDKYLAVDDTNCPTGERVAVSGDYDFRKTRAILRPYDNCYITNALENDAIKIGTLYGRDLAMTILTNQKGLQLYTGNNFVCLETQRLPNEIEPMILKPNELYHSVTHLKFFKTGQ